MELWGLTRGFVIVGFIVFELIVSTFVGRISYGGSCMSSSSVSMNRRLLDLPWRNISGW